MPSQRKRKSIINEHVLKHRRRRFDKELRLWDQMVPVGREFGSPDFERLMEEDFGLGRGVFDPVLATVSTKRQIGFLKGNLLIPEPFDAPLPHDVLADFEGGTEVEVPEDHPQQPRARQRSS